MVVPKHAPGHTPGRTQAHPNGEVFFLLTNFMVKSRLFIELEPAGLRSHDPTPLRRPHDGDDTDGTVEEEPGQSSCSQAEGRAQVGSGVETSCDCRCSRGWRSACVARHARLEILATIAPSFIATTKCCGDFFIYPEPC